VCCWSFNLCIKAGCETLQIALHIASKLTILGWKFQNYSGRGHTPLPRPFPRWGGGHPLPHPTPLGACGASTLAPSALGVPTLFFFYKLTTVYLPWTSAALPFIHFPVLQFQLECLEGRCKFEVRDNRGLLSVSPWTSYNFQKFWTGLY